MLIRDKHLVVAFESRKLNETEHRARIGYGRSSAKKETSDVSRNLRNLWLCFSYGQEGIGLRKPQLPVGRLRRAA